MLTTGKAGQLAEGRLDHADSMAAEGVIPFGIALKKGTSSEKQVKAWDGAASTDVFAGIALYSQAGDLDNEQYADKNPCTVLRKGIVWVKLSANSAGVTAGDKVAVRDDGLFDKAPLTSGTNGVYGVEIENAEFKSSGSAGDLVKLEINMPTATNVVQL